MSASPSFAVGPQNNFTAAATVTDPAMSFALQKAETKYPPRILDERGKVKFNDDYVLAFFMVNHHNTHYNPVTHRFYVEHGEGPTQENLYDEEVKRDLHATLVALRNLAIKGLLPQSPNGQINTSPLYVDTGPKHLATLLELLKIVAVKPIDIPEEGAAVDPEKSGFDDFVSSELEDAPGTSVTVEEAYEAYAEYCISEGHARRYSQRQFYDRIGEAVKRSYGISKNHDIVRDGRARRGFRNLRLKVREVEPKQESSGTDRTTRTAVFMDAVDRCHADLTAYLATAV